MNWTIEAHSYGIVTDLGPASHNFWVIKDSNGNVVTQLHGLATDPTTRIPQAVGFGDDELSIVGRNSGSVLRRMANSNSNKWLALFT